LTDIVAAARAEAARLGHDYIGSEHLFLALLESGDPSLGTILTSFNLDPAVVRERVERRAPKGRGAPLAEGDAALRSGAKRALEASRSDGNLLHALLRDGKGPAAVTMQDLGVPVEKVRAALQSVAPAHSPEAPSRAARPPRSKEKPPRREAPREPPPPPATPRLPPVRESLLNWRNVMLVAVPVSMVLYHMNAPSWIVFTAACLAVLPLAGYMGEATEHLAVRTGPAVGGLLNATFGNAAELIIAIAALRAGLVELVKASITGSILGNLLLILGLSLVAGGFSRPILRFNRTAVGMSAGMLALAVTGMVFPAVVHALHGSQGPVLAELRMSEAVSVVLIITYLCSLWFTLKTHKRLLAGEPHPMVGPPWRLWFAVAVLGIATVGVAVESEILVHATQHITQEYSYISETFLGLIIIPIIGNAAEHATAVVVARKGQIDLALQIAQGSSTQVALLIAPVLVFLGLVLVPSGTGQYMNLVFAPLQVVAVFLATLLSAIITLDGESHWFEGVQLLALYAMIAVAVYFI
jgi:Ca2+:H+ antiporter